MTPIDFWVTILKVKVTGALNVRIVSAHCLENHVSQNLHFSHIDWSYVLGDVNKFMGL
jgi:hypothetical protein